MKITDTIRARIALALEDEELSLYRISKDTGISYAMLHRFSKGDRGNGDTIDKLAEYFALELTPLERKQRKSKGG